MPNQHYFIRFRNLDTGCWNNLKLEEQKQETGP